MSEENEAVALLPCPFCGSADVHFHDQLDGVVCKGCKAQVFGGGLLNDVETWNRRIDQATITDLQSQVRTLTEALDRQNGTPCEQIRHQHEVEALNEKLATQRDQSAFIVETLRADLASARADVEMLREALDDYGYHKVSCDLYQNSLGRNCTCGLSAALAPQTKESHK